MNILDKDGYRFQMVYIEIGMPSNVFLGNRTSKIFVRK